MSSGSDPVAAWEALLRTHAALVPVMGAAVEAAAGLPLSWYDVLLELSRSPERRLRMQDLGERVVLSRSQTSRIVDAMVAHGLVTRASDPDDGRAIHAGLTAKGRSALRNAAPAYLRAIEEHFGSRLEEDEIRAMRSGLERIVALQAKVAQT